MYTCFILQYHYACLINVEDVMNDVLAIHIRRV